MKKERTHISKVDVITSNSREIKLLKANKNYEHLHVNKVDASKK